MRVLVGLLATVAGLWLGAPVRAQDASRRSVRVLVTAYCLRGHTASGTRVAPGTVAVDPRLIRLGSRLYVPGYGQGRALDTGGAIRGYHIDVWMGSCSAALRWGVRYRTITVY